MSKFLILFFTIFSQTFSLIIITDKNSHCEFDIRHVHSIGLVEVDNAFIDYVLDRNCFSCLCQGILFSGKKLQKQLLDYIKVMVNLGIELTMEEENEYIEFVNNLIHIQEIDKFKEPMKLRDIISMFSQSSYHYVHGVLTL